MSELRNLGFSAPPFYPGIIMVGGFVVTFPPALICTIIALRSVGASRCKLAWVSLFTFLAPLICGAGAAFVLKCL